MAPAARAAKAAGTTFLKRITPKSVTERIGLDLMSLPRPVEARVLYDLFGVVTRAKLMPPKDDKPASIKFFGEFQAVTPDGEVFDSGATFIPMLDEVLNAQLETAQEADPKARAHIALRIAIEPAPAGKPSATGYVYDVQRLIPKDTAATDPIALLRAEAAKHNPKQIAGPAVQASSDAPSAAAAPMDAQAQPAPAEALHGRHARK